MKRLLFLFLFALSASINAGTKPWPLDPKETSFYPFWEFQHTEVSIAIGQTIHKSGLGKACSSGYHWAESRDFDNIYYVACYGTYSDLTKDASSFYIMKTDTKKALRVMKSDVKEKPECAPTGVGKCGSSK